MIAYASRALTKPEKQYGLYSECLAALKQFHVGRSFNLVTDHAPLQWLSTQKMEELLRCWGSWALALQDMISKQWRQKVGVRALQILKRQGRAPPKMSQYMLKIL